MRVSGILILHNALLVAVPVALFDAVAFIMLFLTFGKGDFQLGQTLIIKVQPRRHNGIAFTRNRAEQLVNLPTFQQQAARSCRCVL